MAIELPPTSPVRPKNMTTERVYLDSDLIDKLSGEIRSRKENYSDALRRIFVGIEKRFK